MTRSISWRNRSALPLAVKSRSRWRICQPSTAITVRARARAATASHARSGLLASGLGGGNGDWFGMAVSVDGAHGGRPLAMNREIANGGVVAAHRTLRIAP